MTPEELARLIEDYKKLRKALKEIPYMSPVYMQSAADQVLRETRELP